MMITTTMMFLSSSNSDMFDPVPDESSSSSAAAAAASSFSTENKKHPSINDEEQTPSASSPLVSNTPKNSNNDIDTPTKHSRFLQGDELHRLRRRVWNMKQSLYTARQTQDIVQIQQLTCAILAAQNLDAEYIYTVSLQQQQQAIQTGRYDDAARYAEDAHWARESLLQFALSGLWVGKYQNEEDSFQLINVTYSGDVLTAYKITAAATCHVPPGEITFRVDLTPTSTVNHNNHNNAMPLMKPPHHFSKQYSAYAEDYIQANQNSAEQQPPPPYLEPIQLHNEDAIEQWGIQYLQRHYGMGQVATTNYQNPQFIPGQLILINEQYFSFVWMPTQHHVFFGRPSPELILKLLRQNEHNKNNGGGDEKNASVRQYLERCYEETLLMDDEMEVNDTSLFTSHDQTQYYIQDGCFE